MTGAHSGTQALAIIERLRRDMEISPVDDITIISRPQIETIEAALLAGTPAPSPQMRGDAIRILHEGIDGAEADMQSDADAGERVDLFDYEISLPYETAREIAALLRASTPIPNLSGWRDINTAPVGKSVIICTWWKHIPSSAFRAEGYLDRDTKTWRNQDGSPIIEDRTQPTHWMHIPEGPSATTAPQPKLQGVWDEIGTALALLDESDASPKARALIREALESATGCKAPQYLGGSATPLNSGEAK